MHISEDYANNLVNYGMTKLRKAVRERGFDRDTCFR
jgi:hypothetical protein